MSSTVLDLNRKSYMNVGGTSKKPNLNYLSAKYKNIRFLLNAEFSYTVDISDVANSPGIAFNVYGDRDYWWVVCLYNGVTDPINGFVPGMVLQLPTLADINALLSAQDTQQTNATVII
jgi:hypothetical protein